MGRATSVFQLIQSSAQVILLLVVGMIGDFISLRIVIVSLAVFMFILSIVYSIIVLNRRYKLFYKEE